ncbi:MAG: hypothetical protein E4H32_02120 [Nitrospirales bacterium]|nr:MAG: hypothetical protein E4H32_02120 [Nitrospirales bacterium]
MKALFQKLLVGRAIMMVAMPALALGAADTDMEMLAKQIKADKKLLVVNNMTLTNEEASNFWPLYDEYQKELHTANLEIAGLVVEFAEAYAKGPIPNETAKKLLDDVLALEDKEVQVKRSYADKMREFIPAWKVTRYMQIESKIRAVVKFELAARIPLTY